MNELNGYIKLFRKLIKWGWYKDNVVKGLFLHLLLIASFRDFEWLGRELKAGQVVTGRKKLAEELGFSEQQIRTALKKLESTKEITTETTNKYTIITVVNWEDYQGDEKNTTKSLTNEQPTSNQQVTNKQPHIKNIKNNKNKKNRKKSADARPSLSLILDFIIAEKLNVDGKKFFEYYSNRNWKFENGDDITDWKSLLRSWDKNEKKISVYPNGYSGVKKLSDE